MFQYEANGGGSIAAAGYLGPGEKRSVSEVFWARAPEVRQITRETLEMSNSPDFFNPGALANLNAPLLSGHAFA